VQSHDNGNFLARRSAAPGGLLFVLLALAGFLPGTQAQQAADSPELELGVLITTRAEDADAILKQLKAGADFGVLAKEKSIDTTAGEGGYLGRLSPASLRPELADALRGISVGQFTDVVPIPPSGFAILTIFPIAPRAPDLGPQRIRSLLDSGAILGDLNASGMITAESALLEYAKPDGWNRDLQQLCEARKGSYSWAVDRQAKFLAAADANPDRVSPSDRFYGHGSLAQLKAYVGDMDGAIREWTIQYQIAQSSLPDAVTYMQETLGVAYLHKSEMENGMYRDSGVQDIFPPLHPGAHYAKQEDSKLAVQYLLQSLERAPNNLAVRWLLNLAYVTLGEYPAKVPPKYLIPLSVFASKESVGRFTDVAPAAGLNVFAGAGGLVVEDFDNDGRLDVVTTSQDMCDSMHYFHNNGDGTFSDRSVQAGLSNQLGGLNLVAADYNNDGCMDLLVLRGGWESPMRKSLLRNNCDGTFTDVTQQSGLGETVTASQTAAWADVDNDGYLDLFIGNENTPSQLFRNKGDGTFEDISHAAGVDQTAFSKGVVAADYDNDGYVDFYVSNTVGANFFYHNNHDLTFTEIAKQAGVQTPYYSFATWFFDYDNDGWPDLFVADYLPSVDEVMRSYLGLPYQAETVKLYRNLHNGAFQDVTAQVGLDKVFMPMGANFGDVDNDGFLDIYLGMGTPSFASLTPHVLLRNKEGKSFVDITASSGTGELHKGHGVAFADLERTGHEDILAQTGGAVPSDKHAMRVFQNPGNDNDWINVRLLGVKSNRSAVGAQIKITVENDGGAARSIYRTVGDTSSFGVNPLEQHIGLGHGARILGLDVWWPATNTRQRFAQVHKNQFIAIQEFATGYTKLKRQPARLGENRTAAVAK
jgi:FG-GAP-like repeat/ASPIC and UnbV/PPIC-type PPIASE domain